MAAAKHDKSNDCNATNTAAAPIRSQIFLPPVKQNFMQRHSNRREQTLVSLLNCETVDNLITSR